jgi:hypothetical protein
MTMKKMGGNDLSKNPEETGETMGSEIQEHETGEAGGTGGTVKPPIDAEEASEEPKKRKAGFDLAKFRLPQNFTQVGLVEKRAGIRLGKPTKHSFFRVNPSPDYQFETRVLEYGENRDLYLVSPELCDEIPTLLRVVTLRLYVTLDGVIGIWPLPIPDELRPNRWHISALEIALKAEESWVRMAANMAAGEYDYVIALNPPAVVKWPTKTFDELIREAFKGRIIDTPDHPVLRALRGAL